MPERRYQWARTWMQEAAQLLCTEAAQRPAWEHKTSHRDLVTAFDRQVEAALRAAISAHFPEDYVIGEESDNGTVPAGADTWYIDPIDGTTNFISMGKDFAISLAFFRGGAPVFGIVTDVARRVEYRAFAGGGSWRDETRLTCVQTGDLSEQILLTPCVTHALLWDGKVQRGLRRMAEEVRAIRSYGSVALELCALAAGEAGLFAAVKSAPWDHNAARLIVEEAGGAVRTAQNRPLTADACGPIFAAARRDLLDRMMDDYITAGGE